MTGEVAQHTCIMKLLSSMNLTMVPHTHRKRVDGLH